MLVGKQNHINQKMLQELNSIKETPLVVYDSDKGMMLAEVGIPPTFVIFNLLDIENPVVVLNHIKTNFPEVKTIALHYFENEQMIASIMTMGFDGYIPLFQFSEKAPEVLQDLDLMSA